MRRVEVHMERAQKIGVRSRVDPARNVAGDRAAPLAPTESHLKQRLAQSRDRVVDVFLAFSRPFEDGRNLDRAGFEVPPRQIAIHAERFEGCERLDTVPGSDPGRHAEGKAVHQERGEEVPAHRRSDFLGD